MSFLDKSEEQWTNITDKEIDSIVNSLGKLERFLEVLNPKIREFRNALQVLKTNKKEKLILTIEIRAAEIKKEIVKLSQVSEILIRLR